MHEHAALTIEHAKVKKMLLADKDHELREYEYQWGVAKANVAASEGELMVVEEEVAVSRVGLADAQAPRRRFTKWRFQPTSRGAYRGTRRRLGAAAGRALVFWG